MKKQIAYIVPLFNIFVRVSFQDLVSKKSVS